MNLKDFSINILLTTLCLLYKNCILGAESKLSITFGETAKEIQYTYAKCKTNDIIINKSYIDLSNIELQDKICNIKLSTHQDSSITAIFDDCIRKYHISDAQLFCDRYETPLTKVSYSVPKMTATNTATSSSQIQMSYRGDGTFCGKDTMLISGNIYISKANMQYAILPSQDTIKSTIWVTEKDEERIIYNSSTRKKLLLLEETSYAYLKDFAYPIFIDCKRTYTQQGKVLLNSRNMLYLDYKTLANIQESYNIQNNTHNTNFPNKIISKFHICCQGKILNATLSTKEDCNYKLAVAHVSGILYTSQKGQTKKDVSKDININMTSFPSGRYTVYLYVNGERLSRTINI